MAKRAIERRLCTVPMCPGIVVLCSCGWRNEGDADVSEEHQCLGAHLLPCPFCGSGAIGVDSDMGYQWARCNHCGAEGPSAHSEDGAIAAWNRRKEPRLGIPQGNGAPFNQGIEEP